MKNILILLLINSAVIYANQYQLDQIHKWADVLNIEGGTIAKQLKPNQKWFNIATILDRPYIDGVEFETMSRNKKFDLKESAITEYNELQNLFVHISLIKYCIDNAHTISNKKDDEPVQIIIQIHRPKSGIKYNNILNDILRKAYPEFTTYKKLEGRLAHELFSYELPENITIHFRYGSEMHTLTHFEFADIIISISLVAGFSADLKPGNLVIPTTFLPMDLDTMQLKFEKKYVVKNYMSDYLDSIITSQDTNVLNIINSEFKSPNKDKSHLKATRFSKKEFNEVSVLHVNKNFSPSLLPKEFSII